jgi:hypothetical protein
MRRLCHPSSLLGLVGLLAAAPVHAQSDGTEAISEFTVLSSGRAVGTAVSAVTPSADGWTISASENLGPPLDLTTSRFQVRYSRDWSPISIAIEGVQGSQAFRLSTTFADGTARSQGVRRGQPVEVTHQVSPQAIVVPTDFFPAYEALAARLASASVGTELRLYIAPQGEIGAVVREIVPHRLSTPTGTIDLREYRMVFDNPGVPIAVEVWIDERDRLARLAIPVSRLVVLRNDISSSMTREVTVTRLGDEEVFIPGNGFSIAATLSKPEGLASRAPAVILVGGTGRQDRDELTDGVPVLGHLANAIADAGFLVVRYDKRGVGRSGGRVESATLADYADDALRVLRWLRERDDVDEDRIAMIGYAEGGAMAMLAARREKRVAALGLLAAPGRAGRELTLLQQERVLERAAASDADRQAKMALQQRVIEAVLGDGDWADIPSEVRNQADTAYFRSWLEFDPAELMEKLEQPVLVLTGALDAEYPPDQAERLAALAREREDLPESALRTVVVPGVNHLLVSAEARGAAPSLTPPGLDPTVTSAVVDWLRGQILN